MKQIWATLQGFLRLLKVVAVIIVGSATAGIAVLIGVYIFFARDLPNIKTVSDYRPYVVSTVYGSDGTPIGEFWNEERRFLVELNEVPPLVVSAFIAAEDSRFFEHRGIDFKGTFRAALANVKTGSLAQGGSTITQQVTRSLLLSRKKTFARKIREAILATRLERYLTKDQILHLYLNQIFLGNRAFGIKAAAQNYFHKEMKDLNLTEISLLAGLPRAPMSYSPIRHPDKAAERQRYVLSRLVEEKIITQKTMDETLKTEVKLYQQGTDKENNLAYAPHLMENLRQVLLAKYGADKLYYEGLKIYTGINPAMQKAAQIAIQRGLEDVDRRTRHWRGTLAHIDPKQIEAEKQKLHQEILQSAEVTTFPPKNFKETPVEPGKIYKAIVVGFQGEDTKVAIGLTNGIVPKKDIVYDQTKLSYDENLYMVDPPHTLKVGDVIRVRVMENGKFQFYQPPEIEGALFSMEPSTGLVKAMVGGYDFRRSEFNRAMDALRQPGSAFKPFVYSAALDKGYTLRSPIADSAFSIPVGVDIWSPKNYDSHYHGLTTIHDALVHSYNVATARVGFHIRLHYLTAYLRKMGVTTPVFKYPSMTLGANDVHLSELVAAYSTFPNLGFYRPPLFITKVVDQKGIVLEETTLAPAPKVDEKPESENNLNKNLYEANKPFIDQDQLQLYPSELKVLYGDNIPAGFVMTPQTAYLMIQMMKDVVNMGTGQRVKKLNKPVAGKTGTSNDISDTWFIGYVPDLSAGVWVGYDQVKGIGKGEQGGRTAAPIFLDFMQEATKNRETKDFAMPKEAEGKDLFAMTGGSAKFAEYVPMSSLGLIEGGSSEDRSADFFQADINNGATSPAPAQAAPKREVREEESF